MDRKLVQASIGAALREEQWKRWIPAGLKVEAERGSGYGGQALWHGFPFGSGAAAERAECCAVRTRSRLLEGLQD